MEVPARQSRGLVKSTAQTRPRILYNFSSGTTKYTQSDSGYFLAFIPSVTMEKSARAGEGARPTPFTLLSTIMSKVGVCTLAEREDTLPLFLLYAYMCEW
jgi:hypothetical protein